MIAPNQFRQPPPMVDMPLLTAIIILCTISMVVLYSAGGEDIYFLGRQGARIGFAASLMFLFARIPPSMLVRWSPILYGIGLLLLVIVLGVGIVGKGAQRWLELGGFRFQPAEPMKLVVPMMVAWILSRSPLPPPAAAIFLSMLVVLLPVVLVIAQPDFGTAILIFLAGGVVIFLAGIGWKMLVWATAAAGAAVPMLWTLVLHDYQRSRILTLFDPWADPLGAGYHIIQSVIAVGSGGIHGKGWLTGTQSRLEFIPERTTDFIFSVYAEEFGFLGALLLVGLYLFIGLRGLMISFHANDTYSRLLGGCLSATFFFYVFVNIGMTAGILPVVGVPLPLLSHGGSAMVTLMIGLGILMSIHRHKKMP